MIRRTFKDFDYDSKVFKSYKSIKEGEFPGNKFIKDLNKINRSKWKLHLRKIMLMRTADELEQRNALVLRKQ